MGLSVVQGGRIALVHYSPVLPLRREFNFGPLLPNIEKGHLPTIALLSLGHRSTGINLCSKLTPITTILHVLSAKSGLSEEIKFNLEELGAITPKLMIANKKAKEGFANHANNDYLLRILEDIEKVISKTKEDFDRHKDKMTEAIKAKQSLDDESLESYLKIMQSLDTLAMFLIDRKELAQGLSPKGYKASFNSIEGPLKVLNAGLKIEPFGRNGDVLVNMPPTRLLSLINNLTTNATNAIKHSPNKDGKVSLELRQVGRQLQIKVSDSCGGIPETYFVQTGNNMIRLFTPVEKPNDDGPGTRISVGMGEVSSIVNVAGGDIQVKSETGKGTAFTIELPIAV